MRFRTGCSCAALAIAMVSPMLAAQSTQPRSTQEKLAWPGADRSTLRIPDAIWGDIRSHAGFDGSIGFTRDEMARYGRDRMVLRSTLDLFGDARGVTRETGRLSGELLEAASGLRLGDLMHSAYDILGHPAGRGVRSPSPGDWGVGWIPQGATPSQALESLGQYLGAGDDAEEIIDDEIADQWASLPVPVQRLVVRMLVADALARPWIRSAVEPRLIREVAIEQLRLSGVDADLLSGNAYRFEQSLAGALELWRHDPTRMGTEQRPSPAARALLEQYDSASAAFGSVLYARHAAAAIDEFEAWRRQSGWEPDERRPLRGFRFETPLGPVRILSSGNDRLAVGIEVPMEEVAREGTVSESNGAVLVLDLGGDDTYLGRVGTPNLAGVVSGNGENLLRPIAAVIDLGGNDLYDGSESRGSVACGLLGIGAIFDLRGDDTYRGRGDSVGRALYGSSMLVDLDGSDLYETSGGYSQGAAHMGVALLLDRRGDDRYRLDTLGQGFGGTGGVGMLIDLDGNDDYLARDNGAPSSMFRGLSVSMAQGVGCGRRADFGDGYSLAGGWGMLLDAAGDDSYRASVWSQGAGYWWGVGVLEDRDGEDRYRNAWYSLGSAAHFSVGHAVDLTGSDQYNLDNPSAVGQYMGSARDGSIGIFIDGDGNDRAVLRNRSGGCADLGSVGIFWSRRGNDRYTVDLDEAANPDAALGEVIGYPSFGSFRDDLRSLGLFLDSEGRDEYRWEGGPPVDRSRWDRSRSERERAIGIDENLYEAIGFGG